MPMNSATIPENGPIQAERKSRDDASSIGRQEGGYLVVLNSKEEEDFVSEHLLRKCSVDFSWLLSISLQHLSLHFPGLFLKE